MSVLSTSSANIMDLTFLELQAQLAVWKEPRFRAQQLWKWIYVHLAADFEQMSNLPRALRDRLARHYRPDPLVSVDEAISEDLLTHKVLFRLPDGQSIESVMMEYDRRRTVCVSSQVGCPVGCGFCATGQSGYVRDLGAAEIIAQPLHFARELKHRDEVLTNIVVMGMGEPLMNYEAVRQAVETWNDHRGLNVGARKITLSTAGYVPGIRRLSAEELQVGLAVSLHAAEDGLRNQLVPLNRAYPLSELLTACREYAALTGRRITIEYALIDGVNDSVAEALRLADLLRGLLCHVNLIPLNPTTGGSYRPSPRARVHAFQQALMERHIETTVRLRRGIDIQAGCGQLRQRHQEGQDGHLPPTSA
jgi:23S rRNA (adenine2503-C2)-methyltransferase